MTILIKDAASYKKSSDLLSNFLGIHGRFIPAVPMDEGSQQRNILPKVEGEEVDPQLSFGPEEPKHGSTTDTNNEQRKNSAEVKDLIGEVLHFDENMINHHGFKAAARHLSEPDQQEHEDEAMENEPVDDSENNSNDESPQQEVGGDVEKQKETVENNENTNIEKDEYNSKGREENMQFNKLMKEIQLDPGMGSPTSPFHPSNEMVNKEYKEYTKKPSHIGLPVPADIGDSNKHLGELSSSKKESCPHPRCDIDGGMNDFEGRLEPPGDAEVPYEGI